MVVDSNFLERPELRDYLAASKKHFVVLTDYAAMEAYKQDALNSIARRMAIACEFPEQILVLHGTQIACGLTGSASDIAECAIDPEQTAEFPKFCRALNLAQSGNQAVQAQIIENSKEAGAHLARMLVDAEGIADGFADVAASFTPVELKILRQTDVPYPNELLEKMARQIMELAALLMSDHPAVTSFPPPQEAPDRFIFRVATAGLVLATRWIAVGGAHLAKPVKLRNDQVDINFAAFATYYDGLFTADKRLASIHGETKLWLDHVFSRRVENSVPTKSSDRQT